MRVALRSSRHYSSGTAPLKTAAPSPANCQTPWAPASVPPAFTWISTVSYVHLMMLDLWKLIMNWCGVNLAVETWKYEGGTMEQHKNKISTITLKRIQVTILPYCVGDFYVLSILSSTCSKHKNKSG